MSDLSRDVYVTIAPHLRSVFADDTRDVTNAVLAVFAEWLRERAAWSAGESERLAEADDFPSDSLMRAHRNAALVLAAAADDLGEAGA